MTATKTFDLETFTFNGHALRTVLIAGKLWMAVPDVAGILGYSRDNIAANMRWITDDDGGVVGRQHRLSVGARVCG